MEACYDCYVPMIRSYDNLVIPTVKLLRRLTRSTAGGVGGLWPWQANENPPVPPRYRVAERGGDMPLPTTTVRQPIARHLKLQRTL